MYRLSNTAFFKLVELRIITGGPEYDTPWGKVEMFRTRDVSGFLTRVTKRYWTLKQVLYQYKELFFDMHQGECEQPLLRITKHDFRSIVELVDSKLVLIFDRHFLGI